MHIPMKLICRSILIIATILVTSFVISLPVAAQVKGVELTSVYDLPETGLQNGDVLTTSDKGIVRATTAYDSHLLGVVELEPLMVYRDTEKTATPVSRNGTAQVRVSNLNGPIKSGDYLTS